ncbi:hypothetical protein C0J52_21773 [Blattella germanica]|nr:hypothetical protein C0J52_21773 [Blattella germanica]
MLSPRNSMILTRRVYLDPNVPPSPPQEHSVPITRNSGSAGPLDSDAKLKQLTKQMNSIKKKLRRYEEDFEREYGYRPSHADKMGNKDVKKMCAELNKLRKEMKQLKEDPHGAMMQCSSTKPLELGSEASTQDSRAMASDKTPSMEEKLQEVEKHLAEKRLLAGRPESLDELTREQLLDEKVAVQKALLYLEGIFGRPVSKGDRDLVRPLYDRYRALKRLVIRSGPSKLKDSVVELQTILEHETMDFTSSPPSLSVQDETPEASAATGNADLPTKFQQPSDTSDSLWENLHSLSLSELLNQQRTTREEKKRLRRSLREYEEDFQRRTGKKLQREDRLPMEGTYIAYKQAKAKLRLLEALKNVAEWTPQHMGFSLDQIFSTTWGFYLLNDQCNSALLPLTTEECCRKDTSNIGGTPTNASVKTLKMIHRIVVQKTLVYQGITNHLWAKTDVEGHDLLGRMMRRGLEDGQWHILENWNRIARGVEETLKTYYVVSSNSSVFLTSSPAQEWDCPNSSTCRPWTSSNFGWNALRIR